jgi:hypothetical protein
MLQTTGTPGSKDEEKHESIPHAYGELRMKDEKNAVTDEEWRILQHKIKVFHDHVNDFQKVVEAKLTQGVVTRAPTSQKFEKNYG